MKLLACTIMAVLATVAAAANHHGHGTKYFSPKRSKQSGEIALHIKDAVRREIPLIDINYV